MSDVRESGPDEPGNEAVQLLTPAGERVEHPDYAFTGGDAMIRDFYAQMALVRRVDAEAIALQRQGELGLWPSSLGQEGAQIGAAYAMRPQDYAFPTYREHGVTITRGVDPLRLLAMFRGVDTGSWDIVEHNTYMYSIIIGTQGVQATGYGMGLERDGLVGSGDPDRDAAVVCFFGDGATQPGRPQRGPSSSRRRSTRRSSSSARTTSGPSPSPSSASPGPRSTSGRRASASPGSGSTGTTRWPCTR